MNVESYKWASKLMVIYTRIFLNDTYFYLIVLSLTCVNVLPGNLGRVDYITEFEYDLFIRPDTCNPRFRVWFNFTVENVKSEQVSQCSVLLII